MHINTRYAITSLVVCLTLAAGHAAHGACNGAAIQGGSTCLYHPDFSAVSGDSASASYRLLGTSLFPFQRQSSEEDLQQQYENASLNLDSGRRFRDSLLSLTVDFDPESFDCSGTTLTLQQQLYCHPNSNYETAGFVETDWDNDEEPDACDLQGTTVGGLIRARDTFAYQLGLGWFPPGSSLEETRTRLRAVLRTLADLYLMIGDEFFIDGTEFRVAYSDFWSLDDKLDAQINLVAKSRICYAEAVNAFVYGFSPAVGTNVYASDAFDNDLMGLFNLTVERWSSAWREESAKRRVRGVSSSPEETARALMQFRRQLSEGATQTYLLGAALAKKQGSAFSSNGGERLKVALDTMRLLENTLASGLNPLGYDDRFVPLRDFSPGLYEDAADDLADAKTSFAAFNSADQSFRFNIDRLLEITQANANSVYRGQLATLTGISQNDPDFLSKVASAGDAYVACGLDLENTAFEDCMASKSTGALAAKYHERQRARQATNLALKRKDNVLAAIDLENRQHDSMLAIEHKYNDDYRDTLKSFLDDLLNARTITKSETKGKGKDGTTTTTSYTLRNDQLGLDVQQETRLQELLRDYRIANAQAGHETTVQNLLNQVAEHEIEIGLAIAAENAAALDFGNLIRERDNQVFLLEQAIAHAQYSAEQVAQHAAETRILRAQAALDFGQDLNQAVRFAYLAAKTLEYKYMRPLVDIPIGGADNLLNLTDLYKIQDVGELEEFLAKLDRFDTCGYGALQKARLRMSFAQDVAGFTDAYLNPNGTLNPAQIAAARRREWQGYLLRHLGIDLVTGRETLRIPFSTTLSDPWIAERGLYNMKIWYGTASPPCDPIFTGGVAVYLSGSDIGTWRPYAKLRQAGHSTFLDKHQAVLEYRPVNEYLNLLGEARDEMFAATAVFDEDSGLYTEDEPPSGVLWNNGFKGRSVSASNWTLELTYLGSTKIDWSQIEDIVLHLDVLGTPF